MDRQRNIKRWYSETRMKQEILTFFKNVNMKPYLCGGTARDLYMGIEPYGWDVSVKSSLADLRRKFKNSITNVIFFSG